MSDDDRDDLLYRAWGVIANARGWGGVEREDVEWQGAAERWRDAYHAHLDQRRAEGPETFSAELVAGGVPAFRALSGRVFPVDAVEWFDVHGDDDEGGVMVRASVRGGPVEVLWAEDVEALVGPARAQALGGLEAWAEDLLLVALAHAEWVVLDPDGLVAVEREVRADAPLPQVDVTAGDPAPEAVAVVARLTGLLAEASALVASAAPLAAARIDGVYEENMPVSAADASRWLGRAREWVGRAANAVDPGGCPWCGVGSDDECEAGCPGVNG